MALKFTIVCLVVFALLTFLKFVEDSPIRSWKGVFFTGMVLSVLGCYYVNWAFPAPPPPQPRKERVDLNRAELQRTIRRIEGVDQASIKGSIVEINFAQPKPIDELKKTARHVGGAAGYFLQNGTTNHATIRISVRGLLRYRVEYDGKKGFINEQEF